MNSRKESPWVYFSLDGICTNIDGILDRLKASDQMQTDRAIVEGIMAVDKKSLPETAGRGLLSGQKKEQAHG